MLARFERPEEIRTMEQLLRYIEKLINQLETVLCSLDNLNFSELDLNDMVMKTENGSEIAGDKIRICGPENQVFEVGYDKKTRQWVFRLPETAELSVGTLNAEKIIKGGVEL